MSSSTRNVRLIGQPKENEKMQPFYTDFGEGPQLVDVDGNDWHIDRYGVWVWDDRKRKYQVAETFNDFQELINAWGEIPLRKIEPVVKP
jgi:hypothetical protein